MKLLQWPPLLVLYWIACFAATHLPLHQGAPMLPHLDKVVHLGMFCILGFLMALHWSTLKVLVVVMAYAIFDEVTQPLVGRECDIADFVCDAVGAVIGIRLAAWWLAKFASSPVKSAVHTN